MKAEKLLYLGQKKLDYFGVPSPSLVSRLLLSYVLGLNEKYFNSDKAITFQQQILFEKYVRDRIKGKPVSRILCKRGFWKDEFYINPYTLDPRKDSEILVETAIKYSQNIQYKEINVLDLGTGSGCLILSVLRELEIANGLATDISFEAIEVAVENSKRLNLEKKVKFLVSNWGEGINSMFDVIMLNPPYIKTREISKLQIEVKKFDPLISIDGGEDGLEAYRTISKRIKRLLNNKGYIFCEIGFNQAYDVIDIFYKYNLQKVSIEKDLSGKKRCIVFNHKNK